MTYVDTNILLRWLLGDHRELSKRAEELVSTAKHNDLFITDVVVAEIVYVLRSTGRDREQTAEAVSLLLRTEAFGFEHEESISATLALYTGHGLDFADCYLWARAAQSKTSLLTFDAKLQKLYKSSL